MIPRLVVDASVLILSADATRAEEFDTLFLGHDVVSPVLAAYEVGHVAHVKRRADFGRDEATRSEAVSELLESVTLIPLEPGDLGAIARVCEEAGLSFYDAAYLELAERDDESRLVTADDRLRKAATRRLGASRVLGI